MFACNIQQSCTIFLFCTEDNKQPLYLESEWMCISKVEASHGQSDQFLLKNYIKKNLQSSSSKLKRYISSVKHCI